MTSPYLTSKEAAEFLRYPTLRAFHEAAQRYRIPCLWRGREKLYTKDDLVKVWTQPRATALRMAK